MLKPGDFLGEIGTAEVSDDRKMLLLRLGRCSCHRVTFPSYLFNQKICLC